MNRIEAVDPDAIVALYFFGLLIVMCAIVLAVSHYKTRRWPQGHGNSYWSTPKRVNDE